MLPDPFRPEFFNPGRNYSNRAFLTNHEMEEIEPAETTIDKNYGFVFWAKQHQCSKAQVSKIRGWLYYYGKFHVSALRQAFRLINRRLVKWAFNKYKRFKRTKSLRTARLWLRQVSKHYAYLFPYWLLGFRP
jgi:hypothetical protein